MRMRSSTCTCTCSKYLSARHRYRPFSASHLSQGGQTCIVVALNFCTHDARQSLQVCFVHRAHFVCALSKIAIVTLVSFAFWFGLDLEIKCAAAFIHAAASANGSSGTSPALARAIGVLLHGHSATSAAGIVRTDVRYKLDD